MTFDIDKDSRPGGNTRFELGQERAMAEHALQEGDAPNRSLFEIAQDVKAIDNKG